MESPNALFGRLNDVFIYAQSVKDTLESIVYNSENIKLDELVEMIDILELMEDKLYFVIETLKKGEN